MRIKGRENEAQREQKHSDNDMPEVMKKGQCEVSRNTSWPRRT